VGKQGSNTQPTPHQTTSHTVQAKAMSSSRKRSLSSGSQAGGGPPPPSQRTTLFAWATTRRTSSSTTKAQAKADAAAALRAADGSAFYTCPLCGQGFPLTMQSHVDTCQGEKEPRRKPRPAVDEVVVVLEEEEEEAAEEGKGAQKLSAAESSSKVLSSPPLSQASAATPIQSPPAAAAAAAAPASSTPAPGSQPPPFLSPPPPLQAAAAALPSPPRSAGMEGKNAFDVLKRAAAVQYRKEIFTLTRNADDGTLDWAWDAHATTTKAASPAASQNKQQQQQQQHQEEHWWEKEIVLPGSKTARLLLRTNMPPLPLSPSSSSPNPSQRHHLPLPDIPLSVLKSALQKNIRRSRGEAAAKTGLQLLHRAPLELYRRLPIIMLEDGICHPPALVLFTWLMMAGETYTPDPALRKVLVRMLFEIASGKFTDFSSSVYHPVLDPLPDVDDASLAGEGGREGGLSSECQVLLRCLVARRHYGGMACDAHMLKNLAKLWRVRLGVRDEDKGGEEDGAEGGGEDKEKKERSKEFISPALSSLVHSPQLADTPNPSWRRSPLRTTSNSSNYNTNNSSSCRPPSLLSLAPLDYVSEKKLREYLDSSRLWCRWLIWHVQAHGRPLPQAWLPSLATMLGEKAAAAGRTAAAAAAAAAVAPPLENWPAVWRLCVASGGGGEGNEGDIPWSAVDFHVSGVVDEICQFRLSPEEKRRLASMGGGRRGEGEGGEEEVVKGLLRSAMWRFSSSVTDKVSVLLSSQEEGRKSKLARQPQQQGGRREEREEEGGLKEVWTLLRPSAHAYAQSFIKRRCGN